MEIVKRLQHDHLDHNPDQKRATLENQQQLIMFVFDQGQDED